MTHAISFAGIATTPLKGRTPPKGATAADGADIATPAVSRARATNIGAQAIVTAQAMTVLLVVLVGITRPVVAQDRSGDLGLGGQLGDPSGFTAKLYPRDGFAYEFMAAWDLHDFFYFNAHALHERSIPESPLRYYLGPGAVFGFRDDGQDGVDLVLGISGEAGVNFFVEQFEVFLHLTPRLGIIPDTDGHVGGGIGLRYYP